MERAPSPDWNDYRNGPLYYELIPVYPRKPESPPTLVSAACVTCMATGEILDGMGGPALALSPKIVDAIDMRKQGGRPRVVLDAEDYDGMRAEIEFLRKRVAELEAGA